VRATLNNIGAMLRPGMFAQVETITGEPQAVLTVPRTAISFNTYGNFVFVLGNNEAGMTVVKRTVVQTGESRDGRISISGLPVDTQVVRTGLVKLRDGIPVRIDNQVKLDDKGIGGE
jgi:membrane fusion protein (multidrug efflux system)